MKRILVTAITLLCVSTPAFSYDFIFCHPSIADSGTFITAMLAEEDIDTFVDRYLGSTPTLAELQDYDGCMITSDGNFPDPTSFGNVLADYVDGGGVLIIATFAYGGIGGCGIQGDIAQDPYSPLAVQDGDYGSGMWNLDVDNPEEPGHPILDGVTAVGCNWHNNNRPLNSCGNLLVKWTGGANGLAYNDNQNVVGFTGYPCIDYGWMTGDGPLMFRNAFVWMIEGGPPGYFNLLTPEDGTVIDVFTKSSGGDAVSSIVKADGPARAGTLRLYNPTQTPVDIDVEFTWEESDGAEEYEFLVDDDYNFASPIVDETGLTDTTYTHTFTVDHSMLLYWRVVAWNEVGDTQCNDDFSFEFDYNNTNVAPASFGTIKAAFK
jgi:hypothetical protein